MTEAPLPPRHSLVAVGAAPRLALALALVALLWLAVWWALV